MMLYSSQNCRVVCGDSRNVLSQLESESVDLIVTSPPYADARKKQYGGVHPDVYPDWLLSFHHAFWRVLKPHGSLVINIKDKVVKGARHRYVWRTLEAFGARGWIPVDDYVWHKTTAMPGRWPARLRDAWEYCFHLAKTTKPYFNGDAVKVPIAERTVKRAAQAVGNNRRHYSRNGSGFNMRHSAYLGKKFVLPSNVLHLSPCVKNVGHPAAYPTELPDFFIRLLSPQGGLVVDPFGGSGTTAVAALQAGRCALSIDSQETYCRVAAQRVYDVDLALFANAARN